MLQGIVPVGGVTGLEISLSLFKGLEPGDHLQGLDLTEMDK